MKGLFVTGTDTNVGKTIVSCLLTAGLNGKYWKPIQSGLAAETDSEFVKNILGIDSVIAESYRLNKPLSPHHAALIDGVCIEINKIKVPNHFVEPLIIEGAGGVFVPINDKYMMIDLMQNTQFPCILVARSGVGTLNHTLLTLAELRRRNIPVLGVVMNGEQNQLNKKSIELFGNTKVILEIEEMKEINKNNLLSIFNKRFNKEVLNEKNY